MCRGQGGWGQEADTGGLAVVVAGHGGRARFVLLPGEPLRRRERGRLLRPARAADAAQGGQSRSGEPAGLHGSASGPKARHRLISSACVGFCIPPNLDTSAGPQPKHRAYQTSRRTKASEPNLRPHTCRDTHRRLSTRQARPTSPAALGSEHGTPSVPIAVCTSRHECIVRQISTCGACVQTEAHRRPGAEQAEAPDRSIALQQRRPRHPARRRSLDLVSRSSTTAQQGMGGNCAAAAAAERDPGLRCCRKGAHKHQEPWRAAAPPASFAERGRPAPTIAVVVY